MLNRLFIALFVVLAVTGPATAKKMPYGQGVLWQIHMPSSGAINFLFGTMHSTDPRITTLPAPVKQAFARARSLSVEVVATKDMPVRMARRMMLPSDQRLDRIAGAPLFAKLVAVGKPMGFHTNTLRQLKPWAASAAISIPADERAGQKAGRLPLDQMLQRAATTRGIKVFGLESVDEQLDLMDGLPVGDQIKLLHQAVADAGQVSKLVATMKKFYLARDISGLFAWMRRQAAGQDPRLMQIFQDRMINARNRIMASRMAARLKAGGAFVAVGAAHLPGKKGVLMLLARQGYRLSRIY
jgi:uncharacterized protein